jgi:hypothetical protein
MPRATSSFRFDSRTDTSVDTSNDEVLERVDIAKTFDGDIRGTSVVYMYGLKTRIPGSQSYVALEKFTVSVHGRPGTFVLRHAAMRTAGSREGSWDIVIDSGTGDLEGISGTGVLTFHDDGRKTFDLDYALPAGSGDEASAVDGARSHNP